MEPLPESLRAPRDPVDRIGQIVGMGMAVRVQQHVERYAEMVGRLPRIGAALYVAVVWRSECGETRLVVPTLG